MPVQSKAQQRFMAAVLQGKVDRKDKPSKAQAKEFLESSKGQKGLPERKKKKK